MIWNPANTLRRRSLALFCAGAALLLGACSATTSSKSDQPAHVAAGQPSPLVRTQENLPAMKAAVPVGAISADDPEGIMALVDQSPKMQALHENVARETGLILQGSFAPNPVLMLETEMMPIDDMGFGNARNKIRISQRFELAGKADARVTVAEARRDEAEALYFHERNLLQADLARDCCAVLIRQKEVESLARLVDIRRRLALIAGEMNASGRLSDLELIAFEVAADRARAKLASTEAERARLLRNVEGALGLPLGAVAVRAEPGEGASLLVEFPEGTEEDLLTRNCHLIVNDRKVAAARASLELSRSGAWPDLTAGIGYARGAEMSRNRDDYMGAFLEIPLPVVDRNQGETRSAEAAVRQAESTLLADAHRFLGEFRGLMERWERLKATRDLYVGKIIPNIEKELSLMDSQVASGRIALIRRLEAAVDLEETVLAALKVDETLIQIQIQARYLTGMGQQWTMTRVGGSGGSDPAAGSR